MEQAGLDANNVNSPERTVAKSTNRSRNDSDIPLRQPTDQQVKKNRAFEEFVLDHYDFPREQYRNVVLSPAMTGLALIIADYFLIDPSLVNYTINLEDRSDPFTFPALVGLQGRPPRTYEGLYDLFDRMRRKKLGIS